ncbi:MULTISPECIES: purine-nucleoside phosphorylase [Sediminimonas]|uniref:purine-nucleoside phosphorylase n=1 Tax=Sediminimonas TaxID=659427 RepID=UPI00040AA6CB|nr:MULTISPECIES: purine-nucleoside phosphorylase [Sediminimonas]MDR9485058.1 purine-nucleoside phosphorylase [Sediminimonas sp.]
MSIHIGAKPGQIAETVLLPGDPYRAAWAANTFLSGAELVNDTRGMLGYTGTWNGHRVTIHGSGMGMPSLSIYANELIRDHGAKTLIRVGTCGAVQPHLGLGEIILAMTASSRSSPSDGIFGQLRFAPCADWGLLQSAARACDVKGVSPHIGGIFSSDAFYDERPDMIETLARHGVLAVEMEAAELYQVAARHGARALAVLTVSDNRNAGLEMPPKQREQSLGDMLEIALHSSLA